MLWVCPTCGEVNETADGTGLVHCEGCGLPWTTAELSGWMAHEPDPDCPYCHGTGQLHDAVPYGSSGAVMTSDCDCIWMDAA